MVMTTTPLPSDTFTLVEFPGFVRNAEKALRLLGGEAAVPARLDGELCSLAFRPHDEHSRPLLSSPADMVKRCLVLRISRPRQQQVPAGDGAAAPVTARLLGCVQVGLHFPGLADMQYLPVDNNLAARDHSRLPPQYQPEEAEPIGAVQPLLLTPPAFCRVDQPIDYAFKPFSFQGELCCGARCACQLWCHRT
jgi:hypothetical protein